MCKQYLRDSLGWTLMVALVLGVGVLAQAQQEQTQPEGRLVQIGPRDGSTATVNPDAATTGSVPEQSAQPTAPKYWIGLLGGPVTPALRAHLDIPEDQGVMILNVVPEGPSAVAGLQTYDILLAANDTPLHDIRDLVKLVSSTGENQGQIKLEVLRHGKVETISVTPAERPAQNRSAGPRHGPGLGGWLGNGNP